MRLPNKILSYKKSSIGKFCIILDILIEREVSPFELFEQTRECFEDIGDYIETLICLYTLNRVIINPETGRLTYVI